ncbi:MAG TPA: hypothetical protein VHR67_07725 [Aestuariivirgaceae bacterium]|jgi:hypothetical protein|nr:hypothetical protein [Aestuariivirgaceae bacterium]
MIGTARVFFVGSIAFGLLGMLLGLAMAIRQDHSAMPAHAHILVIGWLSFAVFGLFYHLFPTAAASVAARIHCWLAATAAPVLFIAVYLVVTGNTAVEPLAAISSIAYALSFLAFAWAAWPVLMQNGRQSERAAIEDSSGDLIANAQN